MMHDTLMLVWGASPFLVMVGSMFVAMIIKGEW
jgi:hypothetical protein